MRRALRIDPQVLRKVRAAFYRRSQPADVILAALPSEIRVPLKRQVSFHSLELVGRHDSQIDGASKLVFRTAAGLLIESVVLRVASGRTTLCLSTQVGCAAKCEFCATGQMGIARHLSRDEILDQLVQANQLLAAENRRVRNLVFMGMGEPLHNEGCLSEALDVLLDRNAFHMHPQRILVSTVGIPDAMRRLAQHHPGVRLAVSLHSARPEVRKQLMPIARLHSLSALREAIEDVSAAQAMPVMIEYLLLDGLTDTDEDLVALSAFLRGLDAHVNLIPFNPIAGAPLLRPSQPRRGVAFAAALKQAGFRVTTRYSLGADVAAACGQLVQRENQARARADANF